MTRLPNTPTCLIAAWFCLLGGESASSQTAPPSHVENCTPHTFIDVLTHHNNPYRTGANLQETCLTPDNVNSKTFGELFSLTVFGQIYAQPLIVTNLEINGRVRNVVYVVTMENIVYAFDADGNDALPLWHVPLGAPLAKERIPKDAGAATGNYNIDSPVGITSTPVIDRDGGKIFVVAKIAEPSLRCENQPSTPACPVVYKIFALDLISGHICDSQEIQLPPPEHPGESCFWDHTPTTSMDAARINLQRPALLLSGGRIYIGLGSHQDAPCPTYHGMLISFDVNPLKQREPIFMVTQAGGVGKGGIWQAGNGPAADDDGNIYVMTGNGQFEPGRQYGSNFIKLNPSLREIGWFAPANADQLNSDILDIDLGSSGPMLLPGLKTHQIVGGGKQGVLYLVSSENLGGQQKHGWPHDHVEPPIQFFWAAHRWSLGPYSWFLPTFATGYHHIHGSPAFWGEPGPDGRLSRGTLYVWPERDRLKAFAYNEGRFTTSPIGTGPEAGEGMPGGMLSISADHMQNGILWAALPLHDDAWVKTVRGSLRAFKASPDGSTLTQLWTSYCAEPDDNFNFSKYVPPTVANGKVYLATFSNHLNVYGLFPPDRLPDVNAKDPNCNIAEFMARPSYRKTNRPH